MEKLITRKGSRSWGEGRLGVGAKGQDFGFVFTKLIGRWLNEERLKSHLYEVVDGGLDSVETALEALREGKVSTVKYVVKIADSPGVEHRSGEHTFANLKATLIDIGVFVGKV